MKELIEKFPDQLEEAIQIGRNTSFDIGTRQINKVLIVGMGGSGIGASYVSRICYESCKLPVFVINDYRVPAWVDKNTLCIASSYSGNTEETLTAFGALRKTEAELVCITSGGSLLQQAKELGINHIAVPGGWPAPRACLGYSLIGLLFVFEKYGLIANNFIGQIESGIEMLRNEKDNIQGKARQLAQALQSHIVAIYSSPDLEPVAIRFRQQLAENSKLLAWHHVIPEMNHNEIVGWQQEYSNTAVIFLRSASTHPRNHVRMDFMREITRKKASVTIDIPARGESLIAQMLYLTNLADWASLYVAELRSIDPMSILAIDELKQTMAESNT